MDEESTAIQDADTEGSIEHLPDLEQALGGAGEGIEAEDLTHIADSIRQAVAAGADEETIGEMKALAREALVVARDSLPEVSPHQAHYEELELVALRESNEAVAAAKSASGAEYRAALVAAAGALQRAEIYGEEAHRPDPPDANVVDLALASAKRYMRIAQETEGDEQTAALLGVRSQLQIMENHDDDPEAA